MRKKIIYILFLGLTCNYGFPQSGFRIGYNYGFFKPSRNFQNLVFQFNQTHPDRQRDVQFPNIAGGLILGWGFGQEFGMEFTWNNLHATSKTDYVENGVESVAKIKYRLNSFDMGVFFPISDEHRVGFSFDFSKYGIYSINCPADSLDDAKYENVFSKSKMNFGTSIFLNFHFPLSDFFALDIRPKYQFFFFPMELDKEVGLVDDHYLFRHNNFSVSATFLIGKGGN